MRDVNLRDALNDAENNPIESSLLDKVNDWLRDDAVQDRNILQSIEENPGNEPLMSPENLDSRCVYSREAIERVAVKYRLRFLGTQHYSGEIPQEAISKLRSLQREQNVQTDRYYILAPAAKFKLSDCNQDPLLFLPLSNGKFYLVHQWGNDLKWYRSIMKFPFRSPAALAATVLAFTLLLTIVLPNSMITAESEASFFNSGRLVFFFWMNLLMAAILSYLCFAFHFTFSKYNWNSRFFND